MDIHEYQAKAIFKDKGIPVPEGYQAFDVEQAVKAAQKIADNQNRQNDAAITYVVKAQIHAGGRGKGGGVQVVDSIEQVRLQAEKMLGMQLVTHQTGKKGQKVRRLYIEKAAQINKEFYLSLLIDRKTSQISFIASTKGGVNIEEVAVQNPELIYTISVDPTYGFKGFHARNIAYALQLKAKPAKQFADIANRLYQIFIEKDASMIEINPLVLTEQEELICLDAKVKFDDNALFRHSEIAALRDVDEEDPLENQAEKFQLNYIKLDGTIGCMVNGAGLAMATMDIINLYGAEPANFLDVGGGASTEQVTEAFRIIMADKDVKAVLINIFGGIMRCDTLAKGVVSAAKQVKLDIPLIVRLDGTNARQGIEILNRSTINCITASDLDDAAQKAVNEFRKTATDR